MSVLGRKQTNRRISAISRPGGLLPYTDILENSDQRKSQRSKRITSIETLDILVSLIHRTALVAYRINFVGATHKITRKRFAGHCDFDFFAR